MLDKDLSWTNSRDKVFSEATQGERQAEPGLAECNIRPEQALATFATFNQNYQIFKTNMLILECMCHVTV